MDWGFLSFLAEPWFVLPWYAIGIAGFFYVVHDIREHNTPLKAAMKWAWPIIVLFFSVIGLALYFGTARAPGIGRTDDDQEKKHLHMEYEKSMFRRVNGAVIHCVAGDGLGIMTAMVIARATGMNFWEEFWFEYLVGFLFGWFIFQFRSMKMMTDSNGKALALAFRAEFFSMLTVMGGMGLVMGYITPMTVSEQPAPLTWGFWGFGMFGLLLGYVFTWPMNYMMVKIGWKHGMGDMKTGKKMQVETSSSRKGLLGAMVALGAFALVLPAWMVEVRDNTPIELAPGTTASAQRSGSDATPDLAQGLSETIEAAVVHLQREQRSAAMHAVDAAHRASMVSSYAVSDGPFTDVMHDLEDVRRALHNGNPENALRYLTAAGNRVEQAQGMAPTHQVLPSRYDDAVVLDPHGVKIGEVVDVRPDGVDVALGGARGIWGILNFGGEVRRFPTDAVATGRPRTLGNSLVTVGVPAPARGDEVSVR